MTNNAALDRNALVVGVAKLVVYGNTVCDQIGSMSFGAGARVTYVSVTQGWQSYFEMTITNASAAQTAFQPDGPARNYYINGTTPCP